MLTQAELKSRLHYCTDTGIFIWTNPTAHNVKCGDKAGGLKSSGYIKITFNDIIYNAHRLAWLYVYGEFPNGILDHINRIKHDNRISNLREVTQSENLQNQSIRSSNKSGFRGVHFDSSKNKWVARISINKKNIRIGLFDNKQDAIDARKFTFNLNFGHICLT